MTSYAHRVETTIKRIAKFGRDYAVSVSWGKDSVAMLHLAALALGRVTAVHGRYSPNEELPDIPAVRDAVLSKLSGAVDYVEVPVYGDWEIFERAGKFFTTPETSKDRALINEWKNDFVHALEDVARAAGCIGMMIGMAGHESHARRLNIAMRGDRYQARNRMPTLLPLARWSADDVITYHLQRGLPWLHIYDVADDPRQARSEFAFAAGGGDAIRRHGAWLEWRKAYPDLWHKWTTKWLI